MFGEHHRLFDEFPEYKERIHELKINNQHFAELYAQYQQLDDEVYRIIEGIDTPSDEYTEEVKKKRLFVKDELFEMIKAERSG